jgi:hypothetical protein
MNASGLEWYRGACLAREQVSLEGLCLERFSLEYVERFVPTLGGRTVWLADRLGRKEIDRIGIRPVDQLLFLHWTSS